MKAFHKVYKASITLKSELNSSLKLQTRLTSSTVGCEAWQIHNYGGLEELQRNSIHCPVISRPDQVLVNVQAASVNPLDVAMLGGYGSSMLNLLRQAEKCTKNEVVALPLTLGRDFSGMVAALGNSVEGLRVGDPVWGVLSPHLSGTHATQILVPSSCVRLQVTKKPENLSMAEASSIVYAAMTAWSALQVTGGLAVLGASGRKVLVLGGSGGVGTMAVQMAMAWGCSRVVSTCSADAVPLLHALGVPIVIDYTKSDLHQKLQEAGKYDIILDCAGLGTEGSGEYLQHLSESPLSKYITLKSPLLKEMDGKGVIAGALSSVATLIQANLQPGLLPRIAPVRWAYFMPLPPALRDITQLVKKGKLSPCLDSVFGFEDVPKAFAKMQAGHSRGKIVINVAQDTKETPQGD